MTYIKGLGEREGFKKSSSIRVIMPKENDKGREGVIKSKNLT